MSNDKKAKDLIAHLNAMNMDINDVIACMKKDKEDYLAEKHKYRISQGKDRKWRTYVKTGDSCFQRRQIVKRTEEELIDFLYKYYKDMEEQQKPATLRHLYPKWLDYKSLHTNAPTYIARINSDWKTYYLDTEIIDQPLERLDKITLDTWAHRLIKDFNMTKTNYYNVTLIIRQILDYAADLGLIVSNPFRTVKIEAHLFRKSVKKADETQVYSNDEIKALTEMAWEDFYNRTKVYELAPLAVLFQFQTALRIGELCALCFTDIENGQILHVQRMVRRDTNEIVPHTKTDSGDRRIPLTNKALRIIELAKEHQKMYGKPNDFIFSMDGRPLKERAVADLYEKYCKKMDIILKSSHKVRKTSLSALLDSGMNINTVRSIAGHSNEKTTLTYYIYDRTDNETKRLQMNEALSYRSIFVLSKAISLNTDSENAWS